jgi:hypothetical protein
MTLCAIVTRIGSEKKKQHLLNILSSTAGNKQAEARTQKGAEEQYRKVDHTQATELVLSLP